MKIERGIIYVRGAALPIDGYEIGDRVKLTSHGIKTFPRQKSKYGKITGWSRSPNLLQITFDNRRSPTTLHMSFIEKDLHWPWRV